MSDTEYISKDAFVEKQRNQYCVNCERRKGIKNGKKQYIYAIGGTPCRACDIEDMIDAVWDFIAADVAPVVHGHYIKRYLEETGRFDLECSNCKFRVVLDEYDMQYARFCNNCGAKMDESEDTGNE